MSNNTDKLLMSVRDEVLKIGIPKDEANEFAKMLVEELDVPVTSGLQGWTSRGREPGW